jgi:hypothetical protein
MTKKRDPIAFALLWFLIGYQNESGKYFITKFANNKNRKGSTVSEYILKKASFPSLSKLSRYYQYLFYKKWHTGE